MSRILRRPMFRGGRVDGRGTGIASGLGYEKGGRVKLGFGGALKGGLSTTGSGSVTTGGSLLNKAKTGISYLNSPKFSEAGILQALKNVPAYGDKIAKYGKNLIGRFPALSFGLAGEYLTRPQDVDQAIYQQEGYGPIEGRIRQILDPTYSSKMMNIYKQGYDDEGNLIAGVKPEEVKTDLPDVIDKLTSNKKGLGESSSDDLLDIDKEKFAKLLGRDKARGEDISNMLLSFAGKALKPEANVKTAFGEFFEEEAKRPSSQTKIDQGAAQLAINKYIKGEISKAEMEKLVMLNRTKISDQIELQKAALTLDTALQAGVKNGVGSSKKSIAVIQSAVEQVYGDKFNFGGPLPETAEEINVSTIYVKDNEKSSGAKDLVYIDPTTGNLEILKTIF